MIEKAKVEEIVVTHGVASDLEPPIAGDAQFADLGLDSLDVFNILNDLEALSGIQIPDEDVEKVKTIDSILKYFEAKNS